MPASPAEFSTSIQGFRARGLNENTNGLLRQYFRKRRTDLSGYTQSELDQVAMQLNQRPRKTLGFQTPASKLQTKCCVDWLSWQRLPEMDS
jgi:IS30 family transposase